MRAVAIGRLWAGSKTDHCLVHQYIGIFSISHNVSLDTDEVRS